MNPVHFNSSVEIDQSRNPLLDGVRGLAILLVLLIHFLRIRDGSPVADFINHFVKMGWLGVDLFFVLSGFLITGILIKSKGHVCYFRNFYARRALRIFPLYYIYIVTLALLLLGYLAFKGYDPRASDCLGNLGWAATYLINIKIFLLGHPVDAALNHFWSLAIEEQFYLVWPFVVIWLSRERLMHVCVGLVLFAMLLRWLLPAIGWNSIGNHVLMPCRVDGLAIGAWVSLFCTSDRKREILGRVGTCTAIIGLLLIVSLHGKRESWSQNGNWIYLFAAITSASFIAMAISPRPLGVVKYVFGSAFLRAFGKYAYALYVFNQLVAFAPGVSSRLLDGAIALTGSGLWGPFVYASLGIGFSYLCAWSSWRFIEERFLRLKERFA